MQENYPLPKTKGLNNDVQLPRQPDKKFRMDWTPAAIDQLFELASVVEREKIDGKTSPKGITIDGKRSKRNGKWWEIASRWRETFLGDQLADVADCTIEKLLQQQWTRCGGKMAGASQSAEQREEIRLELETKAKQNRPKEGPGWRRVGVSETEKFVKFVPMSKRPAKDVPYTKAHKTRKTEHMSETDFKSMAALPTNPLTKRDLLSLAWENQAHPCNVSITVALRMSKHAILQSIQAQEPPCIPTWTLQELVR